jgi:hypothetical protein
MNLNVIGNGFDLYHGLPSSYFYFGCFLIENYSSLYEELSDMYGFKKGISKGYPSDDFTFGVEKIFWSEFEKHLGEIELMWLEGTLQDDLGLECDDAIDLEMYQYENSNKIKSALSKWINDIVDKKDNYKIIFKNMPKDKFIEFNENDFFLSFNYTHTLENIYSIDDYSILHIHGESFENQEANLVIGHCNDKRINDLEEELSKNNEDYYDQYLRNRNNESQCLLYSLEDLRKDVKSCLRECDSYFKRIKEAPQKIYIYGLSLGEVDLPYLDKIRIKWPKAIWYFSYFSKNHIEGIEKIAENYLNLKKEQYNVFEFENKFCQNIEKLIVKKQCIKVYDEI